MTVTIPNKVAVKKGEPGYTVPKDDQRARDEDCENYDSCGCGSGEALYSGACCFSDGTCQVLVQLDCGQLNGAYQGDFTTCSPNLCAQLPAGACCFDGDCAILPPGYCRDLGGLWQGTDTICDPNPCSVMWSEPPDLNGMILSSEQILMYGLETELANDFVPTGPTITHVTWWGGYYNNSTPCLPGILTPGFNLRFYEDAGWVPGNLIADLPITQFTEEYVGCQDDGYPMYKWGAYVNVNLVAGNLYWFSAQIKDHPYPPLGGRLASMGVVASESVFKSAYFGYPDWTPVSEVTGIAFDASQEFESGVVEYPEACCFPDEHCEFLIARQCSAWGGQPHGPGTVCDPNPCRVSEAPPVGDETAMSIYVNQLFQNEPNPFNPRTMVRFSLAQNGPVRITVFDVSGRSVKTILDGRLTSGIHSVIWDGTNGQGKEVPSGVYWVQMEAVSYRSNMRLIVLR